MVNIRDIDLEKLILIHEYRIVVSSVVERSLHILEVAGSNVVLTEAPDSVTVVAVGILISDPL